MKKGIKLKLVMTAIVPVNWIPTITNAKDTDQMLTDIKSKTLYEFKESLKNAKIEDLIVEEVNLPEKIIVEKVGEPAQKDYKPGESMLIDKSTMPR